MRCDQLFWMIVVGLLIIVGMVWDLIIIPSSMKAFDKRAK